MLTCQTMTKLSHLTFLTHKYQYTDPHKSQTTNYLQVGTL
jgi:hypothetical protein